MHSFLYSNTKMMCSDLLKIDNSYLRLIRVISEWKKIVRYVIMGWYDDVMLGIK